MKSFLKSVFATIVGLLIFSIIGFILLIGVSAGIIASAMEQETKEIPTNSVMKINLKGILEETYFSDIYTTLLEDDETKIGLNNILASIKKAKTNDNIKGIYIETNILSAGSASLREIRNALSDFKESGKFVVAYSGAYTQGGYYLASISDKVFLNPQGSIALQGAASTPTFYKGLLDKIGIEMQVIKVGTYKSYCEQYTNTEMSDENREQTTVLLNSLWKTIKSEVSYSREMSENELNSMIDSFVPFMDQNLVLENGLVDSLLYKDEVESELKKMVGIEQSEKLSIVNYLDIIEDEDSLNVNETENNGDKISVIYAVGEIDNGNTDGISSTNLIKKLKEAEEDTSIKAVVIRVNSPGGSAYGSEQIWHAVSNLKEIKPVVVSMGDYAASGGYYLSCNATKIFAEPNTITGSIGIFGVIPNLKNLTDKIGVTTDIVKTNKFSDFGNINRPLSDDERTLIQAYVNRGYDLFLKRCADGRGMTIDSINKLAQGRVWSGTDALNNGLIDGLGDLNETIEYAAQLANIENYTVSYPKRKKWYEEFLELPNIGMDMILHKAPLSRETELVSKIKNLDILQASLPFDYDLK